MRCCIMSPRNIEMQEGSPWKRCEDWKPLEQLLTTIAAFGEPAGFSIDHSNDDGPKEIENADDVVEGTEKSAEDLRFFGHLRESQQKRIEK